VTLVLHSGCSCGRRFLLPLARPTFRIGSERDAFLDNQTLYFQAPTLGRIQVVGIESRERLPVRFGNATRRAPKFAWVLKLPQQRRMKIDELLLDDVTPSRQA
jgi:hypothetical protein